VHDPDISIEEIRMIRGNTPIDYPHTTLGAPPGIMAESLTKSKEFMESHPGRISLAA